MDFTALDRKIHDAQAEWSVTSLMFNNWKFDMYKQFILSKSCEMNKQGSNDPYGPVRNVVFQAIRRRCHEYYSQVIGITPRVNVV